MVTISGAVLHPGVYELAFGTPMLDLVAAAGGPSEPLQALLIGGYFGTWVAAAPAMSLRLAREDLSSVDCTLGAGVVIEIVWAWIARSASTNTIRSNFAICPVLPVSGRHTPDLRRT